MNDRNQPPYNPNHYPHQVAYGQPEAYPGNGQQEYQQDQQPLYLPAGPFPPSYTYPMVQGQPEVYGMAPAFPMAHGNPQGYATVGNDMGHFMAHPDAALGANPSQNGNYYGAMDRTGALTPQHVRHPSWGAFPVAGSSTPTPHMHNQGYGFHQNQRINLDPGIEKKFVDSRSDQPNSSGKFICPHCTSPHARKADLQRHIRSVHTQESPYRCLGCGLGFVRSDARGTHWKNDPGCKSEHSKREGHP